MPVLGPYSRASRLANLDGRTKPARRLQTVIRDLTRHLGGDLTPIQEMRVRNIATLELRKAQLEEKLAADGGILGTEHDQVHFVAVCNGLERALRSLGVVDAEPAEEPAAANGLAEYLASRAEGAAP